MINLELWTRTFLSSSESKEMQCLTYNPELFNGFMGGGLFLESSVPASFVSLVCPKDSSGSSSCLIGVSCGGKRRSRRRGINGGGGDEVVFIRGGGAAAGRFLSVTLSTVKVGVGEGIGEILGHNGENSDGSESVAIKEVEKENEEKAKVHGRKGKALNTAKHLWAGAVAAMVSRFTLFFWLSISEQHTYMNCLCIESVYVKCYYISCSSCRLIEFVQHFFSSINIVN